MPHLYLEKNHDCGPDAKSRGRTDGKEDSRMNTGERQEFVLRGS
jgi:hypothetical protein